MSLFKRKQSKEKDLSEMAGSPPTAPNQASGSRGIPNGHASTSVNARRMTSNPMSPGSHPAGPAMPVPNGPRQGSPNGILLSSANSNTSLSNHAIHGPPPQPNGMGPHGPPQPQPQPQSQSPGMTQRPQSTNPAGSFPWSTRPLKLFAPQTSPPSLPLTPFPRYGLSVPAFPSHSGHMLLFGGLVQENVMNDLWSMDVRDCSTMMVKTRGDAPMPRVGHASAIADRIMLVWGGDTKMKPDDVQDEGLYILDLRTQEWTNVPVTPGPVGRYGHSVCMHDTRFFVFGGQAEGAFMNDLWAYDIKQLSGQQQHRWDQIQYTTTPPPKRTGHALVAHQGKLYLFGGTDGMYHYNDTWCLDLATGAWSEMSCIGYIPVPREGHAAAIVDDVIYIFGGRDVNGKDLGDLAAFRITNQRWYMFQNMGPAASARSGHALVAAHGKVFVVGGEANASSAQSRDDPAIVHILDTTKIKYPPDNAPPRQVKARPSDAPSQQTVQETLPQEIAPASQQQPTDTSPSMNGASQNGSSSNSTPNANQFPVPPPEPHPQPQPQPQPMAPMVGPPITIPTPPTSAPAPVTSTSANPPSQPQPVMAPPRPAPPQRPRRDGDDEYRRAMSPTNMDGSSNSAQNGPPKVTSPNGPGSASPPQLKNGFNASILGTRSPSPRLRTSDPERPDPPPDAFYYGKSPTMNGFSGRPSSVSGQETMLRELRTEMDASRKREAAMRVIIGKAVAQGFVGDEADMTDLQNGDLQDNPDAVQRLTNALMRLKQEKAAIQNELVAQVNQASERASESERLRRGALQEAAFLRAKVATLETHSPNDLARIEKERINELERQLGELHGDHTSFQRDLQRATGDAAASRNLHAAAAQREAENLRRAEDAEEAHRVAMEELDEQQDRTRNAEAAVRDHSERFVSMSSLSQQREAERDSLQQQLEEAERLREQHFGVIQEAQEAMSAANTRGAELEERHTTMTERLRGLEEELTDTRAELDARNRDAQLAAQRLAEVEVAHSRSKAEADSLRGTTTSRLGELLDTHRTMMADDQRSSRGHEQQIRALEEEGNSLRKMLREAGQRLDAAEAGVSHHRQKTRDLEAQHQTLAGEMRAHRTKLANAQNELVRYKGLQTAKDSELRDRDIAVTEMETRVGLLRSLLADHGIAVNDNDLANGESSNSRELETKLRERVRAHESAQREIEELTQRCHESEDKVESLGRLMERMKDARSPTSSSMRSPTPPDSDRRVVEAERRMAELESQHKEKMATLEADYQTAVRYVKGTEKMLKRMKDELNKQKDTNRSLQSEIDQLTGRPNEPGARTRDASGRGTPSTSESDVSRRLDKLQTHHNALQAELSASRDGLAAREREVEVLRMRCDEAEREVEGLRDDLAQAQQRINTLLEMGGGSNGYQLHSEDEGGPNGRRTSVASSEEASMAFDKFTKELKQWERARSPENGDMFGSSSEDELAKLNPHVHASGNKVLHAKGHQRGSSEYSTDWVQ